MEHVFLQPNEAEDFNLVRASLNKPTLSGWEEGREEEEEDSEPEAEADAESDARRSISRGGNPTGLDNTVFEPKSPQPRDRTSLAPELEMESVRLSVDFEAPEGSNRSHKHTESPVSVQQHSHKLSLDGPARDDLSSKQGTENGDDARLLSELNRKSELLKDVETIEQVNSATLDEVGNVPTLNEAPSQESQSNETSKDGSSFRSRIRSVHTRSGSITGGDAVALGLSEIALSAPSAPLETEPKSVAGEGKSLYGGGTVPAPPALSRASSENESVCAETSSILASLRNPVAVVDISNISTSMKSLLFKITLPDIVDGVYKEVEFEFDLVHDDIVVLVDEMRADPDLAASIAENGNLLIEAMRPVVETARRTLADRDRAGVTTFDLAESVLRRVIEDVKELAEQGNHAALDVLLPLYNTGLRKSDEILRPHEKVELSEDLQDVPDDFVSEAELESALNSDAEYVELRQKHLESISR
jgi:hypothetical protein